VVEAMVVDGIFDAAPDGACELTRLSGEYKDPL
jgi:hypothetical protein